MTKAIGHWLDEVVVERLMAGAHVGRKPTQAEYRQAVRALTARGWAADAIARHLGLARKTARKYRQ